MIFVQKNERELTKSVIFPAVLRPGCLRVVWGTLSTVSLCWGKFENPGPSLIQFKRKLKRWDLSSSLGCFPLWHWKKILLPSVLKLLSHSKSAEAETSILRLCLLSVSLWWVLWKLPTEQFFTCPVFPLPFKMYFCKFQIMYMKLKMVKSFKLSVICVHFVVYSRNFQCIVLNIMSMEEISESSYIKKIFLTAKFSSDVCVSFFINFVYWPLTSARNVDVTEGDLLQRTLWMNPNFGLPVTVNTKSYFYRYFCSLARFSFLFSTLFCYLHKMSQRRC